MTEVAIQLGELSATLEETFVILTDPSKSVAELLRNFLIRPSMKKTNLWVMMLII
jgi:hypothetical protein